jgi:hypothetical protein
MQQMCLYSTDLPTPLLFFAENVNNTHGTGGRLHSVMTKAGEVPVLCDAGSCPAGSLSAGSLVATLTYIATVV